MCWPAQTACSDLTQLVAVLGRPGFCPIGWSRGSGVGARQRPPAGGWSSGGAELPAPSPPAPPLLAGPAPQSFWLLPVGRRLRPWVQPASPATAGPGPGLQRALQWPEPAVPPERLPARHLPGVPPLRTYNPPCTRAGAGGTNGWAVQRWRRGLETQENLSSGRCSPLLLRQKRLPFAVSGAGASGEWTEQGTSCAS